MSSAGWEVVDGHPENAQVVTLADGVPTTVRVLAPPGYSGPTTPLDWTPYDGPPLVSASTEIYSGGWYVDDLIGSAVDPDELAGSAGSDNEYPSAAIECYQDGDGDRCYYTVGLTSYSDRMFNSGLPPTGPNQTGPQLESSGSPVWQIRGRWNAYTQHPDDPVALQLQTAVLHIALVPHAMVLEVPDETLSPLGGLWTWREWPTKAVLEALTEVHSMPAPAVADYTFSSIYGTFEFGRLDLSLDLTIDPTWIVDGHVHFAYWLERTDTPDRMFSTAFADGPGINALVVELDYADEPSVFESAPITATRMLQWSEFPVFAKERWHYSLEEPEWTAWLQLNGPSDAFMTYLGPVNTHVNELSANVQWPDWPQEYPLAWNRCIRRMDGMLVMNDIGVDLASYPSDCKAWVYLPNGMLREDGEDPEVLDNYETPDEMFAVSNIMTTYVRVSIGAEPIDGHGVWRDRPHANLAFQAKALQGVDYSPGVWHWQDGDDHDGFQGHGYAHAPITPLPFGPPTPVNGMALQFQSSIEGWVYDGREGLLGHTDATGPFFYGWLNPSGFPGGLFDTDAIFSYDHGQTDVGNGQEDGRLFYGVDWTAPRWGELYDVVYPPTYYSPVRGDMYQLTTQGFNNEVELLHKLTGPGVYSDLLGPVIPPNVTHGWAIGSNREWDVTFMIHLSAFPDSIFVGWWKQPNAGDYYVVEFLAKEIDKNTGAVIRDLENCPPNTTLLAPYNGLSGYNGLTYAQASPDGRRIEWYTAGGTFFVYDLLTEYYLFNIECAYGTSYPANAYQQFWWPDNAMLTADAPSYDVWLKATRVSAGGYGLTSDFSGMDAFWGQACNGQALIRADAPVTVQYGIEFYDDDRVLLDTQWGPTTAAPAGDSTVAGTFTPPTNTHWLKMVFRSTGGGSSFAIKHPGLWRPGRPVGSRSAESFLGLPNYFNSWDAATDTLTRRAVTNGDEQLMGWTYDGRLIVGYVRTHPKLWNPYTDEETIPSLQDYEGKGYNGGLVGTDGRYIYYHQLNYHIEPTAFILGPEEMARIDPHTEGTEDGSPLPVLGDTVRFGGGVADTFDEFYRYDLSVLSTPPGPELVSNGSGASGIAGWQYTGNGFSHLASTGTHLRLTADSWTSFMSLYSDQGSLDSDYGHAIALTPNRSYRISATFATDGSYAGRIVYQMRLLNADGSFYDVQTYVLPSPDQGEIPKTWGFTFEARDAVAVVLEIGIDHSSVYLPPGTYLDVWDVQLHDVGGPVPIEYLFNIDPSFEQTYGIWLEPRYNDYSANFLSENAWNPTSAVTADDIGVLTGSADLSAGGGVLSVAKTGGAGTVVLETARQPTSKHVWGAFDYWQAFVQVEHLSGGTDGTVGIRVVGYDAAGTQVFVGDDTSLPVYSLTSLTDLPAPEFQNPGSGTTAVTMAVQLLLDDVSADLVLGVRHLNLRAGYNTYGLDRDPALGILYKLYNSSWTSASGSSISYDFSWWGWPQSFIPAIAGEEPQLAFSRWLTDPTKASHSDIGFTRMLPP